MSVASICKPNSSGMLGYAPVLSVSAATTLANAQSGSVVSFSNGSAYTISLPAPTTAGLRFIFIQSSASAANTVKIDASGAGLLLGGWINQSAGALTGATTAGTAVRYLNFLTGASVKGDQAYFVSDGTNWYVQGFTGAAAGMSLTTS